MLGSRKGEGDSHQNSSRKQQEKKKSLQLLARKIRDLKTSIWILLLRTNGSFYSVLPLD